MNSKLFSENTMNTSNFTYQDKNTFDTTSMEILTKKHTFAVFNPEHEQQLVVMATTCHPIPTTCISLNAVAFIWSVAGVF